MGAGNRLAEDTVGQGNTTTETEGMKKVQGDMNTEQ